MSRFILGFVIIILGMGEAFANNELYARATQLTTLLRSARSVVTASKGTDKDLIKDPAASGWTVDAFIDKAHSNFRSEARVRKKAFAKLVASDAAFKSLNDAIKRVITDALAGKYKGMWKEKGTPFAGKFLPARFAKFVCDNFKASGNGSCKLTVPKEYLVNPANKPDAWEDKAIEGKLKGGAIGVPFAEAVGDSYRFILPEYYKGKCLSCHGGEKGAELHAKHGIKKAGVDGGLGGAISITLKK